MKKSTLLFVVLVALLFATSVLAAEHVPTGDRILLTCPGFYCSGTQEYPANTAFHIRHGWIDILPTAGDVPGQWKFQLDVDGVTIRPSYVMRWTEVVDGVPKLNRSWVYNYPEGMTGSHLFTGHWIMPCGAAQDWGFVDECANPMADFDIILRHITINFVD